jgi:citrate lyase subunit beta/citryl-CoA lyase
MPADRPRFHAKAEAVPADEVIFDLEDSVTESNKAGARRQLTDSVKAHSFKERLVAVRVNSLASPWFEDDLETAVQCQRVESIVVPKVSSSDDVRYIDQRLQTLGRRLGIEPQIETAAGLVNAPAIAAASPLVEALHFGPLDMAASMRMPVSGPTMSDDAYEMCLFQVLVAARSSGRQAIDGPYPRITDANGLRRAVQRAARFGYDGKWAIHPDQVAVINISFTPTEADRARALVILEAYAEAENRGGGAVALDGEMLDEAVVRWAQATMSRAAAATRDVEEGSPDANRTQS